MSGRAAIVVVALASAAGAQPSTDHAKAVELFEDGRRFMTDHDPARACAAFAESIRLEPLAAGTMLNLGLCHQQLGQFKTALYWFRKAQSRATETDPPLPAYEQEAREHTTYLATVVATIRIDVPAGAARDARVTIDDEPVRAEDFARVEVDAGHHVLVATAPGKAMVRKELDVTGRGGQVVAIAFPDADQPGAPAPPAPPPGIVEPPGPPRRVALYVALGAGALLGSSVGLTLYEKHVYNQNQSAAMHGDRSALAETRHATEIARDYGTGIAVAGLIAGGVAAYLFLTTPDERTVVAPTLAPGHAGAVVIGRF